MKKKEEAEEQQEEEEEDEAKEEVRGKRTKQKWSSAKEKGSDSYGRVTVPLYIKWHKGNLAISLRVLGVPAKMLGAQSNTPTLRSEKLILLINSNPFILL